MMPPRCSPNVFSSSGKMCPGFTANCASTVNGKKDVPDVPRRSQTFQAFQAFPDVLEQEPESVQIKANVGPEEESGKNVKNVTTTNNNEATKRRSNEATQQRSDAATKRRSVTVVCALSKNSRLFLRPKPDDITWKRLVDLVLRLYFCFQDLVLRLYFCFQDLVLRLYFCFQ
ncbi:uncharacterized protein V6R79_022992 [Siganus canaliculatus]